MRKISQEDFEDLMTSMDKDFENIEATKHIQNYKIKMLGKEFFMLMSDIEYRGASMLAAMSHGAIEITLVK